MSCILRISGEYEHVLLSIGKSELSFSESISTLRKRERDRTSDCTFNCVVSEENGGRVPAQIDDAILFLRTFGKELDRILNRDIILSILDFSWDIHDVGQWNRLPLSLLKLCVQHNLDIEMSVYPITG